MQDKKIHHIIVGGISTNCWVYPLDNGGECVVIDPAEEGDRIIALLDRLQLIPRYIVLTHGHFDHIGAVPALVARYVGAQIAIHTADAEYLGPDSYPVHCLNIRSVAGDTAYVDERWKDMPLANRLLEDGDKIGPFTVLHLPGHTSGSIGLWDEKEGVLFSGDTLFCGNYGRTDLPGGSSAQMASSLRRLFAMDSGIQVYPGHGPSTTIGREAAQGLG